MPPLEEKYPNDHRPRRAIEVLHEWISTGRFSMKTIGETSLPAHVAAKEIKERMLFLQHTQQDRQSELHM